MKKEQVVNMKISYQREFKHNYLIIDTTELLWQGYECHMMAQNQIDGILRFQIRQMDDGVRFMKLHPNSLWPEYWKTEASRQRKSGN